MPSSSSEDLEARASGAEDAGEPPQASLWAARSVGRVLFRANSNSPKTTTGFEQSDGSPKTRRLNRCRRALYFGLSTLFISMLGLNLYGVRQFWSGLDRVGTPDEPDKVVAEAAVQAASLAGRTRAGLRRDYMTGHLLEKPTVPISLVIPCQEEDLYLLPMVMESLANQTVFPHETIFVLNLSPQNLEGYSFADLDFSPASLARRDEAKEEEMQLIVNRTENKEVARRYLLNRMMNLEDSLVEIPNLKIQVRAGQHFAGQNRMFGAKKARNDSDLISFWDCDDYLHPQRTEFVWKTFELNPDLEALIHGYRIVKFTTWDSAFEPFQELQQYMPNDKSFFHSYETIHKALPVKKFAKFPHGEPPQQKSELWWYPRHMNLPSVSPYPQMGHNGWLTVKPEILKKVRYPESHRRGQDSLYNWRLIKKKVKFNVLPLRIGAYVRPR